MQAFASASLPLRRLTHSIKSMCLGIPGKVIKLYRENDILMGKIDFNGIFKAACLEHVPEVRIGEYVLVHVGFALSRLDETEAKRVFEFLEGLKQLNELQDLEPTKNFLETN